MAATVRLTVLTGPHKNRKFCFCGPARSLVGRAPECFVQFSGMPRDQSLSRHHCQLEIDPPLVKVQDLGSLNGTYLNGRKVEAAQAEAPTDCTCGQVVNHGDLLTINGATMMIEMVDCPKDGRDQYNQPIWEPGQTAKKDCPVLCQKLGR